MGGRDVPSNGVGLSVGCKSRSFAPPPPERREAKGQGSKFQRRKTAASGTLVQRTSVPGGLFLGKPYPGNGHVEKRPIAVE